ncbi:MAG: hypothetical protein IKP58_12350 [Victivallales bacterium]|nr:hypothetical protein [Victivallales bacterium]
MDINDFICKLLEKVGLKKDEKGRIKDEIARLEEELRDANDVVSSLEEELKATEQRLRNAKAQYDDAMGSVKAGREALVRSLMKECKNVQERQQVTIARRDAVQALLQQRRLELEQLLHPVQTDALEEANDNKKDILYDLRERDKARDQLEKNTYQPSVSSEEAAAAENAAKAAEAEAAARLEREYAELMGEKPQKAHEPPKTDDSQNAPEPQNTKEEQ